MEIAVLGTGAGARAHAARLTELGHRVTVGTRDPRATLARTEPDLMGTPPYPVWQREHPGIPLETFAGAAGAGELVINGIDGANALRELTAIADRLAGKVLIDYAVPYVYNPDIEHKWTTPWGWMPRLDPVDTDSLAERIQRALPGTGVVKTFVTQEQETVVHPERVGGGEHTMFVSGDDPEAKAAATDLLRQYGWTDVLDLGGLACARGQEMYGHLHTAIGLALGAPFGVRVVR
ncbi:hypothetical protein J0910_17845 [Nocardiopsis sp. CNT-189]|uniref:NADPH-dependent F420 reductase n=1 Tax=Nocardiopsis oceanisediminis TaxID=2816862 RepID=UPI003B374F88